MRIEDDVKFDYCDVLIRPKRSTLQSRKDVNLHRTFQFKCGREWTGVPIVASNMDTTGTLEMSDVLSNYDMITCLSKHIKPDKYDTDFTSLSFGMNEEDIETLGEGVGDVEFLCLDVANGYNENFVDFVRWVRKLYPDKIIIAGNVVTSEQTEALILAGTDIVKVGIGPGSVCTTRKVTGVGYPQLSAVIECADAAHGLGGHVMADGGCICPGDVAKSFGAGADFVMLGGMLAGHDECAGDIITEDSGESYKVFYGMSSDTAMNKHNGGVATYRASEGKTVKVKYRGAVSDTVNHILGGLRSACTYVGAKEIKHLPKCTTFVKVYRQLNTVYGE
jgi:GMP reductase